MPILHASSEFDGRPIIEVIVAVGATDRATQPGEAVLPPRTIRALIDTGASRSHVAVAVLESLALNPSDRVEVYTASTGVRPQSMDLYSVDLSFGGDRPGLVVQNLLVIGTDKLGGLRVDMLLGRDVLDRCLLIYDGINRRFSLAFNPPVEGAY